MYIVYVLHSRLIDRLYIGQTQNIERRLIEHTTGNSVYTSRSNDWELIYKEKYANRAEAMKREKELKSFRGREFIRKKILKCC